VENFCGKYNEWLRILKCIKIVELVVALFRIFPTLPAVDVLLLHPLWNCIHFGTSNNNSGASLWMEFVPTNTGRAVNEEEKLKIHRTDLRWERE
jgi:hypothetical protein